MPNNLRLRVRKGLLILLISAIGTTWCAATELGSASARGSQAPGVQSEPETKYQRTFQLAPNGHLVVHNYKGKISIEGWDQSQVAVDVYKYFDGSDSDRQWWLAGTEVKFSSEPRRLEIDVKYPNQSCDDDGCDDGHRSWYTGFVELTIHAPRQVNVELNGYKPETHVASIQGDVAIKSYKSPIEIRSTVGAIRINTYKDAVRLIDVDLRGPLELRMYKGEALIDAKRVGESADVETSKGEITLRLPENQGLNLEVKGGRRAGFHSDFPILAETHWGYLVRGTINGGGPRVRLSTEKGGISIQKKFVAGAN